MARFHKSRTNQLRSNAGTKRSQSFDAVLEVQVPVSRDGQRIILPAEQAFLVDLQNKARKGDGSAAELLADFNDVIKELRWADSSGRISEVRRIIVVAGSVSSPLELLRMAQKFDRYSNKAHMKLEPWLVQAALARLGRRQLSLKEQRIVYDATRTPHKVRWPDWWEVRD
jgi:hypothetical protein